MPKKNQRVSQPQTVQIPHGYITIEAIRGISSTLNTLIRSGSILGCVYFLYLCVAQLSGKTTMANFGIQLLGNLSVDRGVLLLLTGGSIIYGYRERRLRVKDLERHEWHIHELEKQIDPGRTSSTLTRSGETNPVDRL